MLSLQISRRFDTGSTTEAYIPTEEPEAVCGRCKHMFGNNGGWYVTKLYCHKYRTCKDCLGRRVAKYMERVEWYVEYVSPVVMITVSEDRARALARRIPSDLYLRLPQMDGTVVMFIDAGWRAEVLDCKPVTFSYASEIVALDLTATVYTPEKKRITGDLGKHDTEVDGESIKGEVWFIGNHDATDDELDDAIVDAIYATPDVPMTAQEVLDARNNRVKAMHDALNARGIRNYLGCREQTVKINAITTNWLTSIYLHERGIDGNGRLINRTRAALKRRENRANYD